MMKVAVVTPYYKETAAVLRQCHESVLAQTHPCHHILVADGHPVDMFESSPRTMHVVLPQANADNGNTPRAIGGLLAESYGFDAVAYLDADNWYRPEHIERLLAAHLSTKAPLVCSKRNFYTLDGELLPVTEAQEDEHLHIDTSCWIVFRPAFAMLRAWLMPKQLGPVCDRIFLRKAIHDRFEIRAVMDRTVAFRTQYAYHYQLAGAEPPPDAKTSAEFESCAAYLKSPEGIAEVVRMLGFYPRGVWVF
jgi:glycosyltransferase involved in cell wall biosynthesis